MVMMIPPSVPGRFSGTLPIMRPLYRNFGGALLALLLASGVAAAESSQRSAESSQAIAKVQRGLKLSHEFLRPVAKQRNLPRDVRLNVGEGATIQPSFTTSLPVGDRGAKVPVQSVEVEGGRVDAYLPEGSVPRGLLLQGPDKILGISTGGHMVMKVDATSVVIGALEGDVLVGQDSKFKPLPAGRIRVFSRASGMSADFDTPKAPLMKNQAGLAVALTGSVQVSLTTTSTDPLLLSVVDERGAAITKPRRHEPGTPLSVEVPNAGLYYAVARSLGKGDIEGPLSAPVKIQVLGLAPGQRAPVEGVFLLGHGERVRLAGTDGLEVRYGNSPTYLPASGSVGLSQRQKTVVEFRNPQATDQKVVLTLAPRISRKEIELGPAEARWPGAPVQMRIGLWDGAGNLLRPGDDVRVRVTVNAADIPMSWKTTSEGFVGQVPKQAGQGPWVVRVNVLDERGHTIAREFLEVASR